METWKGYNVGLAPFMTREAWTPVCIERQERPSGQWAPLAGCHLFAIEHDSADLGRVLAVAVKRAAAESIDGERWRIRAGARVFTTMNRDR